MKFNLLLIGIIFAGLVILQGCDKYSEDNFYNNGQENVQINKQQTQESGINEDETSEIPFGDDDLAGGDDTEDDEEKVTDELLESLIAKG